MSLKRKPISQFDLGASMYVPTTQTPANLVAIGNGEKYPFLRSVIYCTEDAVREDEVQIGLQHIIKALPCFNDKERPLRFIRVRNPHIMGECVAMEGIEKIDGFVLPKLTASNLPSYLANINSKSKFVLMPTLETAEVFDYHEMQKLRRMMSDDPRCQGRILCLRIGGNDLNNCIRVRRDPTRTIYTTPVGQLIPRLAGEFIPHGFGLTAPVFESMAHPDVLAEEVEIDLNNGLFGKTAIHPTQIQVIEQHFAVSDIDLEDAQLMVASDAPAVFKSRSGRMNEPATHRQWAQDIITRHRIYGKRSEQQAS